MNERVDLPKTTHNFGDNVMTMSIRLTEQCTVIIDFDSKTNCLIDIWRSKS